MFAVPGVGVLRSANKCLGGQAVTWTQRQQQVRWGQNSWHLETESYKQKLGKSRFHQGMRFLPTIVSAGGDDGGIQVFVESPLPKSLPTPRGTQPLNQACGNALFLWSACFASVLRPDSFQCGSIFFKPSRSWPVSSHKGKLFTFVWLPAAGLVLSAEQATSDRAVLPGHSHTL